MAESNPKAVGEVLRMATDHLVARDVYQPRRACELLLSRLLRCKRLELYIRFESVMSEKQLAAMRRGVKRLLTGEPVQYILGEVNFLGRTFKVDSRALIPRPETELIVESVLDCKPLWNELHPLIADVGTGSGCIVGSLSAERPQARYVAIDISSAALQLARENASALGSSEIVVFAEGDLSDVGDPDSFSAVVANLPYVPTPEWENLPPHIREHEPRTALDGGPTGLAVIAGIIPDAWIVLKPGGCLFLEVGAGQAGQVAAMMQEAGFHNIDVRKDLAEHDRIVYGFKAEE